MLGSCPRVAGDQGDQCAVCVRKRIRGVPMEKTNIFSRILKLILSRRHRSDFTIFTLHYTIYEDRILFSAHLFRSIKKLSHAQSLEKISHKRFTLFNVIVSRYNDKLTNEKRADLRL